MPTSEKLGHAAGAVFLLIVILVLRLLAWQAEPHRDRVILEPTINGGALRVEDTYAYGGPVELAVRLPEGETPFRPLLELSYAPYPAELWLDGEPLFRLPADSGYVLGPRLLSLPTDCAGKLLTLSTRKDPETTIPFLYYLDNGVLDTLTRAHASKCAFLTTAFAMVFLLAMGLFLYSATGDKTPCWPAMLLGAAALGQAAYFYAQNITYGAIYMPRLWLLMGVSRAMLFSLPPICFVPFMQRWRKTFLPFALYGLPYFIVAGFQTAVPAFGKIASPMGQGLWVTGSALAVCAGLEYHEKNRAFRFFFPALLICAGGFALVCGVSAFSGGEVLPYVRDIARYILEGSPEIALFWWSTLLLGLGLATAVVNQLNLFAETETMLQALSMREHLAREQLTVALESSESLRQLRHETANHYLVLQRLAQYGEWNRLKRYLSDLAAEEAAIPSMSCAAHPAIDAVLTIMIARARKMGVFVDWHVNVPAELPFPDPDLCTVLINLLQNALDALAIAPPNGRKWMRVILHVHGMHLYIGVTNTRFAPVDFDRETGLCRSTKTGESGHGYGLKAVQAVARKYESELLVKCPKGLFSAATALQMPAGSAKGSGGSKGSKDSGGSDGTGGSKGPGLRGAP